MSMKCFYCHDTPKTRRRWNGDYIQILAIDPARINLALRVERRYLSGPKRGDIETILFFKKDFSKTTFVSIIEEFDQYKDIFLETHVFIIERQMKKIEMLLIMQHLLTYFMVITKNSPLCPDIIEISAKVKGKQLGYDITNSKNEKGKVIKKWSSQLARKMLEEREDWYGLEVMDYWLLKEHTKNKRKDDDLADTICMCECYFQIKFNNYHHDMIQIRYDRMQQEEPQKKKQRIIKIKEQTDCNENIQVKKRKRIIKITEQVDVM